MRKKLNLLQPKFANDIFCQSIFTCRLHNFVKRPGTPLGVHPVTFGVSVNFSVPRAAQAGRVGSFLGQVEDTREKLCFAFQDGFEHEQDLVSQCRWCGADKADVFAIRIALQANVFLYIEVLRLLLQALGPAYESVDF